MIELSAAGAKFIGALEGFRPVAYNDSQGNATIGIGHLLHRGPLQSSDRKLYWSYTRACAQLQVDARSNGVIALQRALRVPLTQPQIDALLCLAFNCGPGSLADGHSVMSAVNSKPKTWNPIAMRAWRARVSAAFMLWAHPAELVGRRQKEIALFCTGKYAA